MASDDDAKQKGSDEEKLLSLREALVEGENSGVGQPFDFDAFLKKKRAEWIGRRSGESV
jgi:Arc/MetJ-type ribon-helix-helix transcriptional regulator